QNLKGRSRQKPLIQQESTKCSFLLQIMLLSPAAERSQDGLLSVLWELLEDQSHRELFGLELGSGTGQHVAHFAQEMPFVTWQPSDIKEEAQNSIKAYIGATKAKTVLELVYLDASQPWEKWAGLPQSSCDIIIAINLLQYNIYEIKTTNLLTDTVLRCHGNMPAEDNASFITPVFMILQKSLYAALLLKKHFFLLSMLKTAVLLHNFVETDPPPRIL
uniref:Zgc:103625 n=1 Tax=Sinocyclocheilus rhinocerous TaxID=307959 RepID=A0A673NCM5_9TELE